jgi:hypothetical protein
MFKNTRKNGEIKVKQGKLLRMLLLHTSDARSTQVVFKITKLHFSRGDFCGSTHQFRYGTLASQHSFVLDFFIGQQRNATAASTS